MRGFALEALSPSHLITAVVMATATAAIQYFTVTQPETMRADLNRDGNWSARDQLQACDVERKDLLARLLGE